MLWPDGRYPHSKTEYMLVYTQINHIHIKTPSSVPTIKLRLVQNDLLLFTLLLLRCKKIQRHNPKPYLICENPEIIFQVLQLVLSVQTKSLIINILVL